MIRVLLVDDQHLIRAGLRMLCDAQPDIEVVGEADNGRDAVALAGQLRPDVVVMDLRMPGVDGITATSRILADRPGTRVLVLTTFGDDDHLYPALTAGACGFLLKDAPPTDLLAGIRRAAGGDSPFSPEVLRRLVQRAVHARAGAPPRVDGLTTREQEVLDLVAEGLSNAEIADRLHIGITTVKTHVTSLMAKTGSPNRVRLALFARGV
ncbi:response regulator transcription factor [Micromonospora endophytica]|uniref:DNA-binding response regulator n=1 Tax=Micromonospora endophytica TaxID=515350 RepID=A0A2W2BT19_9ACTN|nr:response regulator transcription factor [Micromonospora endophytica]PZF89352.1 DNA-binding response regulator [Micromonospora endophytica]RIW42768.1 DNA-binding response regulator [Micromonospora endophytica]BCJ62736.1 DNA-binding response regulator [Micromonospora endophytica]